MPSGTPFCVALRKALNRRGRGGLAEGAQKGFYTAKFAKEARRTPREGAQRNAILFLAYQTAAYARAVPSPARIPSAITAANTLKAVRQEMDLPTISTE